MNTPGNAAQVVSQLSLMTPKNQQAFPTAAPALHVNGNGVDVGDGVGVRVGVAVAVTVGVAGPCEPIKPVVKAPIKLYRNIRGNCVGMC